MLRTCVLKQLHKVVRCWIVLVVHILFLLQFINLLLKTINFRGKYFLDLPHSKEFSLWKNCDWTTPRFEHRVYTLDVVSRTNSHHWLNTKYQNPESHGKKNHQKLKIISQPLLCPPPLPCQLIKPTLTGNTKQLDSWLWQRHEVKLKGGNVAQLLAHDLKLGNNISVTLNVLLFFQFRL